MNKYEFITELQRHLTGKVSPEKLQELTTYYTRYIDSEIRKGKTEEEVLAGLGSPRLLAKSIVSAEDAGQYDDNQTGRYQSRSYSGYEENSGEQDKYASFSAKLRKVLLAIGVVLIICLLISVTFGILGFVFRMLVQVVLPLAVPLFIIWLVVQLYKRS